MLKEGANIAKRNNIKNYLGNMYYFLGEVALKTEPQQAPLYFEKSIAIFQKIKAEYYLARAYDGYGRFYKQQGDIASARSYLTKALEILDRLEILNAPEKVRRELAELH